jgi:hypothetical protein
MLRLLPGSARQMVRWRSVPQRSRIGASRQVSVPPERRPKLPRIPLTAPGTPRVFR